MISEHTHSALAGATPVGFGARSRRILLFGDLESDSSTLQALAHAFGRFANVEFNAGRDDAPPASVELLLGLWRRAEAETHSVSLGLVASKGLGSAAFAQIMIAAASGDPVPGAVALLGFDRDVVETLLTIAERSFLRQNDMAKLGTATKCITRPASAEWPPIAIILQRDDPAREECADACRRMDAAGIESDIMLVARLPEDGNGGAPFAAAVRLAEAIDRFFADHLVADFPRMFRRDDAEPGWAATRHIIDEEKRT